MTNKITLGHLVGDDLEEDFLSFDLTEIQEVLLSLKETEAFDLSHAELLQQQSLRGADLIAEYLAKIIKTTSYLESKVSSIKNKVSLDYNKTPDGSKTTADMRKWAGESSPEVEEWNIKLARAKGSKVVLEKKYDILIKAHHHFKEIAMGMKKTILGYSGNTTDNKQVATGWE